jgi:hypothetical protein
MKRREPELEPELEAFLTPRTIVRSVPARMRDRALTRAKRIIATGGALPTAPAPVRAVDERRDEGRAVAGGRPLARWALVVAVALAAGTVGAMVAVHGRSAPAAPTPASDMARPDLGPKEAPARLELDDGQPAAPKQASVAHVRRALPERDSVAVELALLQRAQTAYAQHDCPTALMLLAEHGRRFPKSRLAEERDALRVRSLICAGHGQEAKRAGAAFAARFPRSVLLPRLGDGERMVE